MPKVASFLNPPLPDHAAPPCPTKTTHPLLTGRCRYCRCNGGSLSDLHWPQTVQASSYPYLPPHHALPTLRRMRHENKIALAMFPLVFSVLLTKIPSPTLTTQFLPAPQPPHPSPFILIIPSFFFPRD